jgi:hypothetical protein
MEIALDGQPTLMVWMFQSLGYKAQTTVAFFQGLRPAQTQA